MKNPERIYYLAPTLLSFLMLTRILAFIPLLNRIGFESLCIFIYLFGLIILFDKSIPLNKKYIIIVSVIIIFITIIISVIYIKIYYDSKMYRMTQKERLAISLIERNIESIDNLVIIYDWPEHTINETTFDVQIPVQVTLNAYFAFKHNITTPQTVLWQAMNKTVYEELIGLKKAVIEEDCLKIIHNLKKLKAKNILVMDFECKKIINCEGLSLIDKNNEMCLLKNTLFDP